MDIGDFLLVEGIGPKDLKLFLEMNKISHVSSEDFVALSEYTSFEGLYQITEKVEEDKYYLKPVENMETPLGNCHKGHLFLSPSSMRGMKSMASNMAFLGVDGESGELLFALGKEVGSITMGKYYLLPVGVFKYSSQAK